MNRVKNHNSNPPKPTRYEYDGVTYIFHSPIFGGWRSSKLLKSIYDGNKTNRWDFDDFWRTKVDLPFQGGDYFTALGFALLAQHKQDNWEAELMKSIEVNRKKFQEWLDYKCLALKYSDMHTMDAFYDWQRDYFKIPKMDIDAPSLDMKAEPLSLWDRLYYFGVDPICKPII